MNENIKNKVQKKFKIKVVEVVVFSTKKWKIKN